MRRLRLIPDDTKFDFFRPMRFWLAVSLLGVLATFVILPIRGLNYGVDFLGGTLILAEFPETRDIGEYREVLSGLGLGDVAVTEASGGSGGQVVLMRLGTAGDEAAGQTDAVASGAGGDRRRLSGRDLPAGRHRRRQGLGRAGADRRDRGAARAARDHGLRLAALRVAVRRRGGGLAAARRDRDRRRLLGAAAPVRPDDRGGASDHHRLLDQRHRGRLRPGAREPAQVQEDAAHAT